jgi:hypothetical protein
MTGSNEGWQTVLPTSNLGRDRLSKAQLETYERQVLQEWERSNGHWSGVYVTAKTREFRRRLGISHPKPSREPC